MVILVTFASIFIYGMIFLVLTFANYQLYLVHYRNGNKLSLNYVGALATDVLIGVLVVQEQALFQERFFLTSIFNEWVFFGLFFVLPSWFLTLYYAKRKAKKQVGLESNY